MYNVISKRKLKEFRMKVKNAYNNVKSNANFSFSIKFSIDIRYRLHVHKEIIYFLSSSKSIIISKAVPYRSCDKRRRSTFGFHPENVQRSQVFK